MSVPNAKQILLSGIISLVIVAGYYRWNIEKGTGMVSTTMNDKSIKNHIAENKSMSKTKKTNLSAKEAKEKNQKEKPCSVHSDVKTDYFAKAKIEKEKSRSELIETLNQIINNPTNDTSTKQNSQKQITDFVKNSEKESIIENLIKLKNYEDCVVFIDEKSINVVVKADELTSLKVAQIKDIIVNQTEFKSDKIKISSHI